MKTLTIAKIISKKKSKVRRVILPNVKSSHITTVIEHWYWYRDRHIDEWDRKGNLEIDWYKYVQILIIFGKGAKAIQKEKDSLSITCAGTIRNS